MAQIGSSTSSKVYIIEKKLFRNLASNSGLLTKQTPPALPHLLSSLLCILWRCYQCFHPVSTPSPLFPDMTLDDVRDYERNMHEKTNIKVVNYHEQQEHSTSKPSSLDDIEIHDKPSVCPF